MRQSIIPVRTIFHAGDTVTFRLEGIAPGRTGRAVVRSNLGRAEIRRREIVDFDEHNRPPAGLDWHDVELQCNPDGSRSVTLPLTQMGVFEAKCCFIPDGGAPIEWAEGDNFRIKVESAAALTANTIYCAFVRQFGENLTSEYAGGQPPAVAELDRAGYAVLPPSGTFRGLIRQLDHIFGALGCRILQLLPIHPVPTTYGRMGLYGSPFAALDYFNVDPALAEFDRKATPLEQFGELVDAVHARDGRIFMDIPVNHTGWASKLQGEHPEYFVRSADGTDVRIPALSCRKVADPTGALVAESTADGLHLYEDKAGVLTNNPPFDCQMIGLANYMSLSAARPVNNFGDYGAEEYGAGLGAFGLPGDYSPMSRFVRAAFVRANIRCGEGEEDGVLALFDILNSVRVPRGCCRSEGGDFYTQYSCCCSAESKTYYFTRGACRTPFAVSLNTPKAAGEELVRFSMGAPVPVNKLNF